MPARSSALILMGLALAAPARAEPGAAPGAAGIVAPGREGELALSKLQSLLFDRLPGAALKVPGSPRYLALQDPNARGTRVLVGWVLPGATEKALPELRALVDAVATALQARAEKSGSVFRYAVSLAADGEAPLVVVELASSRPAAGRSLEEALLEVVSSLGAAQLRPLARAVVEVHRPGELVPTDKRPARPNLYVVQAGDSLAKVARRFQVSQKALVEANHLDGPRLERGQKLVLPR